MSTRKKLIIFIIALLVIDQVVKIWIKTHMMIGDEFSVFGNWFKIHFIENNGIRSIVFLRQDGTRGWQVGKNRFKCIPLSCRGGYRLVLGTPH